MRDRIEFLHDAIYELERELHELLQAEEENSKNEKSETIIKRGIKIT